ncbi:MAG: hypothetical protein ABIG93_00925 [archaeon]|nr:hypothetical protein [Nanoarchaeota archaeon]
MTLDKPVKDLIKMNLAGIVFAELVTLKLYLPITENYDPKVLLYGAITGATVGTIAYLGDNFFRNNRDNN